MTAGDVHRRLGTRTTTHGDRGAGNPESADHGDAHRQTEQRLTAARRRCGGSPAGLHDPGLSGERGLSVPTARRTASPNGTADRLTRRTARAHGDHGDGTRRAATALDTEVISGKTSGSVEIADDGPGSGRLTDTGTLTDTDVDNTFIAVTTATNSTGGYGVFTMTAAGVLDLHAQKFPESR